MGAVRPGIATLAPTVKSASPGGSGRSANFIPAVAAAWSVTTIAFIA
jgi:hypothetical protein